MSLMVGEIEVTKEVLDKLGVDETGFAVLESSEQQRLLDSIGVKPPVPKPTKKEDEEDDGTKVSGILKDLQEERSQRQVFQLQLEQSSATIGQLEETVKGLSEKLEGLDKGGGETVSVGDEDFVTGKQFKAMVAGEAKKIEAEMQKVGQQLAQAYAANQDLRMQISEMQVSEAYSTEKVGPELEYFNVIEKGLKKMLIENPGYKAVIARAKNPALEGYKIGLMHPDFKKIVKSKETAELAEKIDKNTKKPKTGGGQGGGGGTIDVESMSISDLMKLSDETLDRLARKEAV